MELFDYLNEINYGKKRVMSKSDFPFEHSENEKGYTPYVVNQLLARSKDCVTIVNEINRFPEIDKKMHFEFLRCILPKSKRYSKKVEFTRDKNLDVVKQYYKVNEQVAKQYMRFLDDNSIEQMKKEMDTGGLKK